MGDVEVTREFIACINAGDVDGLGRLITVDHQLIVFDEAPVVGRDANIEAWHGYASSWPEYLIYPHEIVSSAMAPWRCSATRPARTWGSPTRRRASSR